MSSTSVFTRLNQERMLFYVHERGPESHVTLSFNSHLGFGWAAKITPPHPQKASRNNTLHPCDRSVVIHCGGEDNTPQMMWDGEKRFCFRLCRNHLQLVPSQDGGERGVSGREFTLLYCQPDRRVHSVLKSEMSIQGDSFFPACIYLCHRAINLTTIMWGASSGDAGSLSGANQLLREPLVSVQTSCSLTSREKKKRAREQMEVLY